MKPILHKISLYKCTRALLAFTAITAAIATSACGIVTTQDYTHQETKHLRSAAIWSNGEIKLDEPVTLVPDFRQFTPDWKSGNRATIFVLSKEPAEVHIKTATLTGPNGTPEEVVRINKTLWVSKKRNRQTSFAERMATGGMIKGKRVVGTNDYIAQQELFGRLPQFDALETLTLKIVASINKGPEATYSFDLDYSKRTHIDFITR